MVLHRCNTQGICASQPLKLCVQRCMCANTLLMYAFTLLMHAFTLLAPAYRQVLMIPKYEPGSTFWQINSKPSIGEIKG